MSATLDKFDRELNGIMDDFIFVPNSRDDLFEVQRRAIGKAHGLKNEIIRLTKRGIAALKSGQKTAVEDIQIEVSQLWQELRNLNMPTDQLWMFCADAGQEVAEFSLVVAFYPFVLGGAEIGFLPSPKTLESTPQEWLGGLADAVTEVSKMVRRKLRDRSLSEETRLELRERFIALAEIVREALGRFETAYPLVVNCTRRRGQGFGKKLGAIDRLLDIHESALAAILDRKAK